MVKMFSKNLKSLFWGHFKKVLPKFGQKWIFLEKRAVSIFKYFKYVSSYLKSEKG